MPLKYNELVLPSALTTENGSRISTREEWENGQRSYILKLMEKYMYGAIPPAPVKLTAEVLDRKEVYDGLGTREQVRLTYEGPTGVAMTLDLLVYIPAGEGPYPCAIGLNFCGNHGSKMTNPLSCRLMSGRINARKWHAENSMTAGSPII